MRRLAIIGAVVLGAALVLGRLGARGPAGPAGGTVAVPPPRHAATAELDGGGMRPPKLRVPKDHEVHLLIRGAPGAAEGLLTVTGYEDRVAAVDIGPGLAREIVFVSDRPGDDFAFRLAGEIVGRLEVTGSHLEEGHE